MLFQFTVLTSNFDLALCTIGFFECWVERIQGAMLSGTGITEEERQMLLHFALRYRAFYAGCDDIPMSLYYEFIGYLVNETLTLSQPESAAHTLKAAVEWLFGNLPTVSLRACGPPSFDLTLAFVTGHLQCA